MSDGDTIIIEDDTVRLKLKKNEIMDPANFVTGSIVALMGNVNTNGVFNTEDFTYANFPTPLPKPLHMKPVIGEKSDIFENIENREFVAILGGLEFMSGEGK
jgi:hypothetical protein